eukprot:6623707-Karenia_brevis.AAC.1
MACVCGQRSHDQREVSRNRTDRARIDGNQREPTRSKRKRHRPSEREPQEPGENRASTVQTLDENQAGNGQESSENPVGTRREPRRNQSRPACVREDRVRDRREASRKRSKRTRTDGN